MEWAAIDVRHVQDSGRGTSEVPEGLQVWLRAAGTMPDEPLLHAAVLAYASDLTLLAAAIVPHGVGLHDPRVFSASLDHAMWFHRKLPGRRVAAARRVVAVGEQWPRHR